MHSQHHISRPCRSYVAPAAIREVMVYQSSRRGPNSVTSLPAAQHGGPSVTPNTQQVVHSFTDDLQVGQPSNFKGPILYTFPGHYFFVLGSGEAASRVDYSETSLDFQEKRHI